MLGAGLAFSVGALSTLDLGSMRRMGPGAFPLLVGSLLCVLALAGLVQNLRTPQETGRIDVISVLGVLAGGSSFAFFTPLLGVIPATAIAVFTTGSAIPGFRWQLRIVLAVGVAIAVWLIFARGLGMPFVAFQRF